MNITCTWICRIIIVYSIARVYVARAIVGLFLDCLIQFDSSGGKRFYTHEIKRLATQTKKKALKEHLVEPVRLANLPEIRCRKFLRHDTEPMVTIFAFFYVC